MLSAPLPYQVSDCVFYSDSVSDLVSTLTRLSLPGTVTVLSYEERDSEQKLAVMKQFFREMAASFSWSKVAVT